VARLLGVTPRRIADVEAARARVGLDLVDRIAKTFDVAPATLLERD
jgi:plasmid maintenance system antidote protein VapI